VARDARLKAEVEKSKKSRQEYEARRAAAIDKEAKTKGFFNAKTSVDAATAQQAEETEQLRQRVRQLEAQLASIKALETEQRHTQQQGLQELATAAAPATDGSSLAAAICDNATSTGNTVGGARSEADTGLQAERVALEAELAFATVEQQAALRRSTTSASTTAAPVASASASASSGAVLPPKRGSDDDIY